MRKCKSDFGHDFLKALKCVVPALFLESLQVYVFLKDDLFVFVNSATPVFFSKVVTFKEIRIYFSKKFKHQNNWQVTFKEVKISLSFIFFASFFDVFLKILNVLREKINLYSSESLFMKNSCTNSVLIKANNGF